MRYLLLYLVTWFLPFQTAQAWMCDHLTPEAQFKNADIVVSVLVLATEPSRDHSKDWYGRRYVETDFLVERTWRGGAPSEIRVQHPPKGAAFGIDFEYGTKIVLFASRDEDGYATSACHGDLNGLETSALADWLGVMQSQQPPPIHQFGVME